MRKISQEKIEGHIRCLTEDIGVRLAGSSGEKRASEYIASRLRDIGADVQIEEFPVLERHVTDETLELRSGKEWIRFPCSLLSNTPGTGGKTIQAPLIFFDSHTEYKRKNLSFLRGKAVVHLGSHIETADRYRSLMQSEPAYLIFVDTRYPGTVPTSDGMFPAYTRAHGAVPIVSAAYMDAWNWKVEGFEEARLRVEGGMRPSISQNIAAVLPGSDDRAGCLYVGGHHDTQADSVGADDNAVGAAAVIELSRVLAGIPRRRTIKLISFGAEEQLSAGSAEYVRKHCEEIRAKGKFMFNFDAYTSHLGWSQLVCNGPDEMPGFLNPFFVEKNFFLEVQTDLIPYADHFPFVAAGVPSACLGRKNCEAGRFFHHRPDDTIDRVSLDIAASSLQASAEIFAFLAAAEELPFPVMLKKSQQEKADRIWHSLFGGWKGF